jgi:hypothetical protein
MFPVTTASEPDEFSGPVAISADNAVRLGTPRS